MSRSQKLSSECVTSVFTQSKNEFCLEIYVIFYKGDSDLWQNQLRYKYGSFV